MHGTLLADFLERAERHPEREAFRDAFGGESWTWGAWRDSALALAEALVDDGVAAGDRVAIFAGNRWLWPVADVGILLAGAVSVGIYPTSAPAQVADVLADSRARWLLTDTLARATALDPAARAALPALATVVSVEGRDRDRNVADWAMTIRPRPGAAANRVARTAAVTPDTLAMLIYTSGSTGEPKGAMLTHRYLDASVDSIHDVINWREDDVVLSFLPFNHAAERITGLWSRVRYGHRAVLVDDHRRIWEAARAAEPTVFGGLPRFYEKLDEMMSGAGDPSELLRTHLGARVRLATSGGAALPSSVAEHIAACGLELLGAYGLTEHLCVAFNRPGRARHDAAGPPMHGTELRIAEDGEILVRRSALTFSGYWGREAATREAFTDDGQWLRTGDLGAIDPDGALRVTGRKKELIALSTGKKVAPAPIEVRLRESPLVSHAVVVGEGRKFLAALLFVPRMAEMDPATVEAGLAAAVAEANRDRSPSEQVKRWVALPTELSESAGEITPTLKVRRDVVTARYASHVEGCYS